MDLKARVESLRQQDDSSESRSLNDFLSGDDVLTSRQVDVAPIVDPHSEGPSSAASAEEAPEQEVDLARELERYLARLESQPVEPSIQPEASHSDYEGPPPPPRQF